jgi:hypothetical protein
MRSTRAAHNFGIGWTRFSAKIPQAKALVGFSRYRAAQEAALEEIGLNLKEKETGRGLLPTVCERRGWRKCPDWVASPRRPVLR